MPTRPAAAETVDADSEEDEQQPKGVPTPSTGPSFFESAGTETSLTFYEDGALHEQVPGESDDEDALSTSTLRHGKKVRRTRKKNHRRVVVSVVSCKYDVVAQAARGLGWRCTTDEHEEFNLLWNDSYVPFDTIAQLNKYQKVNHFPGMSELAKKNLLAKNLNRIAKQMPGEFGFVPPTFILPGEAEPLKSWFQSQARAAVFCPPAAVAACACGRGISAYLEPLIRPSNPTRYPWRHPAQKRKPTLIVKPDAGCQGKGIFLTKHLDDVVEADGMIAQQYLQTPLLVDGYKFDLRLYVLVLSCSPMRILLFKEGLARFCTERYRVSG